MMFMDVHNGGGHGDNAYDDVIQVVGPAVIRSGGRVERFHRSKGIPPPWFDNGDITNLNLHELLGQHYMLQMFFRRCPAMYDIMDYKRFDNIKIMNLLKDEWVRCRFFSDYETEANNHELMMVRMRYPYDVNYNDFQ